MTFLYTKKDIIEIENGNAPIDLMYFDTRTSNSLKNNGVNTFEDLMCKSENDLLKFHGLGRQSVNSIKNELNEINKEVGTDYHIGKRKQKDNMKVEFKDVVNYKFKEDKILDDIKKYVSKTYSSHYAQTNKYQATEIIIDQGHGTGFCMGNILKYAQRYGKKEGKNKADLMKVIHYAIIQLSQDHYE